MDNKEVKQVEASEDAELLKSIDEQIDALFVEEAPAAEQKEEEVEKAKPIMDELIGEPKQSKLMKDGSDAGPSKQTADEGEKPEKAKKEKEGERGRPAQVSDVPDNDEDGKRAKGYDSIQKENSETPNISPKGTFVKAEDKVEISKEDFEFLQKAKQEKEDASKAEELRKAREEQADLIKSAVTEATQSLKSENEDLKKALNETRDLVKSIANRPQRRKSVDNIQAMEKSFSSEDESTKTPAQERFSKSEMMDAAEELLKSKEITLEEAIELDDTGYILNPVSRKKIENYLKKQG